MSKKIKINLGTLFSGIGAIEQALNLMDIEHENIFACDNGELELKLLPPKKQAEYDELKIEYNKYKRMNEAIHKDYINQFGTDYNIPFQYK